MRLSRRAFPRTIAAGALALAITAVPASVVQLVAPSNGAPNSGNVATSAKSAAVSAAAAASIPKPDDYFGFPIGSDGNLAQLDKMTAYFKLLADKSKRVTYKKIG